MSLIWPVQISPLKDELLSSWLVRASLAHGCDPMSLTSAVWPTWRAWTVDIDRTLDDTRLQSLCGSSGLSIDELSNMTLFHHLDGKILLIGKKPSSVPWVIAMGSRNRQHKMGVPYCPSCLRMDDPYFRWQWRLAWHTYCPLHHHELIESCPSCHMPVQYHRISAQTPHIGICFHCGYDLRSAVSAHVEVSQTDFQKLASHVFDTGAADWGDRQISSLDWFVLAKLLLNLIRRAALREQKAPSHLGDFIQATGIDLYSLPLPPTQLPLELLPIEQRKPLLAAVAQMLSLERDLLLHLLKEYGVSRNTLMNELTWPSEAVMGWINELPANSVQRTRKHPNQVRRPKAKEVVRREWARLLRRHGLMR
ncbi:TniQ family protein [Aeromonas enteropelogenes]|uniref:TniQ family protein n=1 Tax=Aeromonas enteropelogenes TaxID=29489 RepID=UPI003BA3C6A1